MPQAVRGAAAVYRDTAPGIADLTQHRVHPALAIGRGEPAPGHVGVRLEPGIDEVRIRQQLDAPVLEHQADDRFQRCRDGVVREPGVGLLGEFTVGDGGQVHALGPAIDIGRAIFHQRRRHRVAGQVGEQGRHKTKVGDTGQAAQQVRVVLEVNVQYIQQFLEGSFKGRRRSGGDPQVGQKAVEVVHKGGAARQPLLAVGPVVRRPAELGPQEVFLLRPVAPAVMHGHRQQALGTEPSQQCRQHPLHGRSRHHRALGEAMLQFLDNDSAVLDELAVGGFHDGHHEMAYRRQHLRTETRMGRQQFAVGQPLLDQVGAHLAAVQ